MKGGPFLESAGVANHEALERLNAEIVVCRKCPRLVEWRERVGREKRAAFADWEYWSRPLPGFGDPGARILIVGLAPAAHGGNRTGRIFTGDRSGDFLFQAVYRCGLSNQSTSTAADDGLRLRGLYVGAVNRCCPPGNRPTMHERDNCLPYLVHEIESLKRLRVLVPLGSFAWDGALLALERLGHSVPRPRPKFGHGAETSIGPFTLVGSFHPSQQNTFTGKLTPEMLEGALRRAVELSA